MEACSTPMPASSDDCRRALRVPGITSHRGIRGLRTLRVVRHSRGTRRVPQRPGLYNVPGVRLRARRRSSVVRSVMHMRVAVILRRRLPNHKDVELTHLRLAASLPCPEGANHHIQPS